MRPISCALMALMATVAASASQQRIKFGPGVCGPIGAFYVKMATETGGQPFPISTEELAKSSRLMETSLLKQMILWASGDGVSSYTIPVDSTVARMMVAGTFDGTGGTLILTAPDGTEVRQDGRVQDTPLNCGRIITVDAPASGVWRVHMSPSSRFWLRVHARSDLSLSDAEFVRSDARSDVDRLVRIQGEPIAGKPATLRVYLSSAIEHPRFQLMSVDARPLQAIDLQSTDGLEFTGTITLPTEPFRVVVNGHDASGLEVQRMQSRLFHGEAVEVIPPAGATVTAGAEVSVLFTIRNHGPAVRLRLVAVDQRGTVIAVDPPALEIGPGGDGLATVRFVAPADAASSGEASILLTASSNDTAALGGFNSAKKTFTVIRE